LDYSLALKFEALGFYEGREFGRGPPQSYTLGQKATGDTERVQNIVDPLISRGHLNK
jgi:hypothetical protein